MDPNPSFTRAHGAEGGGLFCVVAGTAGAPLPGHAPARRADVPIDEDAAAYVHPERDRVVRLGGLGKDPERHPAALRELAGGELDALLDPGLGECPEQLRLALCLRWRFVSTGRSDMTIIHMKRYPLKALTR